MIRHLVNFRILNFVLSKFDHYAFQKANNKGTDHTVQTCRLVRVFVVRMQQSQVLPVPYAFILFAYVSIKNTEMMKTSCLRPRDHSPCTDVSFVSYVSGRYTKTILYIYIVLSIPVTCDHCVI